MTLAQILRILRARAPLVAAAAAIGLTLALLATLLLPQSWRATAEVYVDLAAPNAVSGATAPHAAIAAQVSTQADVISSLRVAEAVVRGRRLHEDPDRLARWRDETGGRGGPVNWLANRLLEDLEVQADAAGSLVRVSMRARDAAEAAALANAFVAAYLATARELRNDPARANAAFFAAGAEQALERLANAKRRLSDYQREHGVIEVGERYDVENERLSELSRQLVALQSEAAGTRARADSGSRPLAQVLDDPVVQRLRERVAAAQARLRGLAGRLGAAHPEYVAARSELESLRAQLGAETARRRASVNTAEDVSQGQVAELETAIAAQRDKVLAVRAHRDQIDLLASDVKAAQRAYELVAERSAVSSLESGLSQTNASVLTPAVAPMKPESPKPAINLVVGLMLGLLAGTTLALARESARPLVRTLADVDAATGLPVLAALPSSPSARARRRGPAAVMSALPGLPRLPGRSPAKA
jgi:chain length determinant protein EpsF